ncbi:MAG: O-antigen ligase family protein [Granulosicoccaceae bacterium]
MASTNSFPDAEPSARGARKVPRELRGRKAGKRKQRLKDRRQHALDAMDKGWPAWSGLKPIFIFLLFPAAFAMLIILTGGHWPKAALYPIAAMLGLYVGISAFTGVELTLACLLLYLPFSTTYVIPLAPGINGTNMLLLLGLFASVMSASNKRQTFIPWLPGTGMVVAFGFWSALSGFTVMAHPGGFNYLLYHELLNYKAWLDQFLLYYIAMCTVRDTETAKRVVLYMCLGAIVLVLYSVPELLDKMGRSSIEKSRIEGPQKQSNNFGGFVAYTILPVGALFLTYIKDYRAWFVTPYFLIAAKVLISTFSRGAYLAIAAGAMLATYYKGKGFLIIALTIAISLVLVFPSIIPESILLRMQSITAHSENIGRGTEEQLDKSSEHRLILWRAAAKMTLEDPILGKGFKGFQALKSLYTERPVHEADPHSMYLYISSQMGLPALVLFLLILAYAFHLGRGLSRNREDLFVRAIGIGGAAATVCYAIICIFGSRAVNLEFTAYFWTYLACMQIITLDLKKTAISAKPKKNRNVAVNQNKRLAQENEPKQAHDEPEVPAPKLLIAPRKRLRKDRAGRKSRRQIP